MASVKLLLLFLTAIISNNKCIDIHVVSIARVNFNPTIQFSSYTNDSMVTITLIGPADRWFGIGIGNTLMSNTYTFIIDDDGTVTERILGSHNAGVALPTRFNITYQQVDNGIRKVEMIRTRVGYSNLFYTFPNKSLTNVGLIAAWAISAGDSFGNYHGATNRLYSSTDFLVSININCNQQPTVCNGVINQTQAHSLTIICNSALSCKTLQIHAPIDGIFNFECNAIFCENIIIHAERTQHVKIDCVGGNTSYKSFNSAPGCNNLILYANNSNSSDISCSGYWGCRDIFVYVQYAGSVSITAYDGGHAGWSNYYADNAGFFSLTCIGFGDFVGRTLPCSAYFWLPSGDNFKINCYGWGCNALEMHKSDGWLASFSTANIKFNGCNQCPATCIKPPVDEYFEWLMSCDAGSQYFIAQDQNYQSNDGCPDMPGFSTGDGCGCENMASVVLDAYMDEPDAFMCPYTYSPSISPSISPVYSLTSAPTILMINVSTSTSTIEILDNISAVRRIFAVNINFVTSILLILCLYD